ncbi:MAG: XdhC family protein [Oscillospiraceae bacterium]|nr:XdhC family protein [Oscillospiraceae bacterium]
MIKVLTKIAEELSLGRTAVFAVIAQTDKSTPRKAGSAMVMTEGGQCTGTVGGGAVEFEAQSVMRFMLDGEAPAAALNEYNLKPDETGNICMVCGGDAAIMFTVVLPTEDNKRAFTQAAARFYDNADSWLVLDLNGDEPARFSYVYGEPADADFQHTLVYKEPSRITLPLTQAGKVYIFGGGHVAQALVPVLARVGFICAVYEDRPEYAAKELFPDAKELILADFNAIGDYITLTYNDYVVVVTRGHNKDYNVARQALATPAYYIGCMGSAKKTALMLGKLREEAGYSADDLHRIIAPIGIANCGETPEEIAISITAQLIQHRSLKNGHIRKKSESIHG